MDNLEAISAAELQVVAGTGHTCQGLVSPSCCHHPAPENCSIQMGTAQKPLWERENLSDF